jgi:hypothetical protein
MTTHGKNLMDSVFAPRKLLEPFNNYLTPTRCGLPQRLHANRLARGCLCREDDVTLWKSQLMYLLHLFSNLILPYQKWHVSSAMWTLGAPACGQFLSKTGV